MKRLLLLLIWFSFGSLYAQETVTLYILDGNDDAYQMFAWESWGATGEMFIDSEKLFVGFTWPPDREYYIGLRYQNVLIPQGSTIESAYVQFYSYEANDDTTNIRVFCEKNANPLAFTSTDYNISDRQRTSHYEFWVASEWEPFLPGLNQRTHDIKSVFQEVVELEDWVANNPIVVLFLGSQGSGNYPKAACSWEYGMEFYAPVLEITYTPPASVDEAELAKSMKIFPNPVSDKFTLSFTDLMEGEYDISIFDLQGRKTHEMNTGRLTSGDYEFELSARELNMHTGIYLMRVYGSQGEISRKIIVR